MTLKVPEGFLSSPEAKGSSSGKWEPHPLTRLCKQGSGLHQGDTVIRMSDMSINQRASRARDKITTNQINTSKESSSGRHSRCLVMKACHAFTINVRPSGLHHGLSSLEVERLITHNDHTHCDERNGTTFRFLCQMVDLVPWSNT